MTTTATRSELVSGPAARGHGDRAFLLFASATGIALVHAMDDALLNRQPGVPVTQHLAALLFVTCVAVPAVLLFPRLRTGVRAGLALAFGVATLTNGALHVMHISADGPSGSDVTGALAAGAGATLVLMSGVLPFLHRGERGHGWRRRWAVRVAVTAALALLVPFGLASVSVGIVQAHRPRMPIGDPPTAAYQPVSFEATDGLELSGWYLPSRNGAAVLLVSTASGDRHRTEKHARLLSEHGYGVLLYDARGAGQSEGSPNGYGWDWGHDISGALDYLRNRPDVQPDRIGGLGLSTGADALIEAAARDRRLGAVVADGATMHSFADIPPEDRLTSAYMLPVMATVQLISGSRPGPPLEDLVGRVSPTPLLLVAAGSLPGEIRINTIYARAAREPIDLWTLPDARHTRAIRDEAAEYERRVVDHFDAALLDRRTQQASTAR
ncbi:MAG TPA: CocE/NonD family hydrolase [Streptomyces sp.]|nr:CocE/NonD family hydrolase [Streptomyces sp.]